MLTAVDSYFNLPFQTLSTPSLFYLTFPTPPPDTSDATAFGWRRMMADDGASSASALLAHSRSYQQGSGAKLTPAGSAAAHHPAASPPPSFGVDPPRPPRDGFE